jgi:hypothetical protein
LFENRFGSAEREWDSVYWFHLTRVPAGTDFSDGILPLHLALDRIWTGMMAIVDAEKRANLQSLRELGVPDYLYVLKTSNTALSGPYAMLVKESAFHSEVMGNHDYLAVPEIIEDICNGYHKQFGESIYEGIVSRLMKCVVKFEWSEYDRAGLAPTVLSYCWCRVHNEALHIGANTCLDAGGKTIPREAIRTIEFL